MTKFRQYHITVRGPEAVTFKRLIASLPDFIPSGNGALVNASLGRAREISRAVALLSPGTLAEVQSVDVREQGTSS